MFRRPNRNFPRQFSVRRGLSQRLQLFLCAHTEFRAPPGIESQENDIPSRVGPGDIDAADARPSGSCYRPMLVARR